MIIGRIPEITIKFSEQPELSTEGKKVTLFVKGESQHLALKRRGFMPQTDKQGTKI